MCSDLEYQKNPAVSRDCGNYKAKPVAIHTCRTVPSGPVAREDSSGEFPVGMRPFEGGVVRGIVRLDPNPSALAAARPLDKLT